MKNFINMLNFNWKKGATCKGLRSVVLVILSILGVGTAWAGSSDYARGYATVSSSSPSGAGKVYVEHTSAGGSQPSTPGSTSDNWKTPEATDEVEGSKTTFDFYYYSLPASGYAIEGWSETDGASDYSNAAIAKYSITTSSSTLNDAYTDVRLYAHFVPVANVKVTFLTPDPKCTYTVKCDGANVAVGSSKTTNKPFDFAVTVNDPAYKLLGWYTTTDGGATKSYFSPNTTFLNKYFSQACSVGVDLVEANKPVFMVGDKLFTDLNAANSAASSGSNRTIVLVSDGIMEAGNYTISSGNTLLIPHTIGSTFVNATSVVDAPYIVKAASALSAFRKLTLQSGVNITVSGTLCVAGKMMSAGGGKASAYPTGELGVIDMSAGGHITLNGTLYCWGFIKGQDMDQGNNTSGCGTITANSGSKVWEGFATGDWRGGTASSTIYSNADTWKFFPFQSYTIQNIEVPVTYNYGATLSNYMSIFGDGQVYNGTFSLVGNTSGKVLFLLKDSGSKLKKWYNPQTDLVCYEMSGNTQLDALNVDAAGETVSSSDYNLPISTSMHIILASNTTISKPVEIQAGAVIEIKSGVTATCSSNVYLFDKDQWGEYCYQKYYYTMSNLTSHKNRGSGTSNALIDDAKFIVDGTLNVTGKLYTTTGGADIMGNGGGKVTFSALASATNMVMCTGTADNEDVAIDQACLHNEDDSYTKAMANKTFHNVNGRWYVDGKQNERTNHTYSFTYIGSGAVSGSGGTNTTTSAVYSNDKTGLEARMKWANVDADACDNWWKGQGTQADWFYNWTENSAWHQFILTEMENVYSCSNNKLYEKSSCTWGEIGETDEDCLYTIAGVKKALVDGYFLALEANSNDPAFHLASDATQYYLCFAGCNWHEATKYEGENKAYIVDGGNYIWYNGAWLNVQRQEPFFYTLDEVTSAKICYEYVNGEWQIAAPYVRVTCPAEPERNLFFFNEALTVASAKKNATITILRDIPDVKAAGVYTGVNTKCTLDLNGKTIQGDSTILTIDAAGGTCIITDNTTEKKGKISMSCEKNARFYAVKVTNGTLRLENGTIFAENTLAYNSSTAKSTSVSAVQVAAGKTFTMNGGLVHAKGCYAARGVDVAGATSANATVNINSGTVTAETTQASTAYGIYAVGGTVNVKPGATINATATTTNAYGICMDASTKKYFGTLNMTGGTVNVESRYTSTSKDAVAAAVYVGGTYIMANTMPNTPSETYRAVATISGGTFNVITTTARAAYGVRTRGTTSISGGTFNVTPKTTMAYGIWAEDGTVTVSGSAIFTAKATATAYGIYANGVTPDNKTGRPYNPEVTVNGGTFNVQTTSKTTAYGVFVNGNTRPVTSTASGNYQGNYSSAGNVTVNGGIFNVTAKTTIAYGAYVAAPKEEAGATSYDAVTANPKCTINGGYFKLTGTGDVNAVNNLATTDNLKVQGGYYSHNGYLDDYKVSPKQVLTLAPSDPNRPDYEYKVANAYLITFKAEDGTGDNLQSSYQEAGVATVFSAAEPTKSNSETQSFVFDGWATTANGAKVYNPDGLPNVSANATYYAHFNPTTLKYRVHLDAATNGGLCETENIYVTPETTVGTLPNATKTGYTFNGWFSTSAATGGTQLSASTVINADAEYYARFTVNSNTLTWHLDGGKVATAGTVAAKNATGSPNGSVNYGTAITVPVVAKTGYTFVGWTPTPAITMPDEAVEYTALWNPNTNTAYTVKHYLQNVDGTYPTTPTETQSLTGTTAASVTPAVKSYDGFIAPATQTKTIAADGKMVVEYQYTRMHYTFTLDAATNGGTSDVPSIEVIHGATIGTVPPDAQKGCNDFMGWFTKPVGGVKITSDFVIEYDMKTLYAQFSDDVRTYPVTYLAGANGTGEIAADTKTCGVDMTLSGSTFTRTGYTQIGWSTTDGGAKVYDLGGAYTANAALTLYPFWTINTYQIKFVDDDGTTNLGSYPQTMEYGSSVTAPTEPTKAADENNAYTFAGWSDGTNTYSSANIPNVSTDVTYTATYSTTPTVASVKVGTADPTYYTTLKAAFDFAADKTTPTITMLKDVTGITTKLTYTNTSKTTVTFDLKGHTVSGKVNALLTITAATNSGTFVIKSSVAGGEIRNETSSTSARYCVYNYQGALKLEGGTIYNKNSSTGASYAVYARRAFTMTGGKLEAEGKKNIYAIYSFSTTKISGGELVATELDGGSGTAIGAYVYSGKTTISGNAKITVTASTNACGARVYGTKPTVNSAKTSVTVYNGVLNVEGGATFDITANTSGAYGVVCYAGVLAVDYETMASSAKAKAGNYASAGTANIKGGTFNIESKGATSYGVFVKEPISINTAKDADGNATYTAATATPKANITGGKFKILGTSKTYAVNTNAANTALVLEGGWYNINTNLNKYTAPTKSCNYHVLPLDDETYKYEVAEAYTVTFKNGTTTLQETPVKKGTAPAYAGEEPTKDPTAEFTYAFDGWSETNGGSVVNPLPNVTTSAVTYYAHFSATKNSYEITWLNDDNTLIDKTTVEYGVVPTHADATKENTAEYTYTFAGWSPEITAVTGDATYIAQFDEEARTYAITWTGADIDERTDYVAYGETPDYGVLPTKEPTESEIYTYKWMNAATAQVGVQPVTGDVTYVGSFVPSARPYTITFVNDDNTELQSSEVGYGREPKYNGETPISTVNPSYGFVGWTPAITLVDGPATYTATYMSIIDPIVVVANDTRTINTYTRTTTTTVRVSGKLVVTAGILKTNDLILEGSGNASGEITGEGTIDADNVYFHLSHEGGFKARTWYAVAVPWEVLLPGEACGVYIKNGETIEKQYLGTTFDLIYYDGASRAQGKTKAWRYVEDDEEAQQFMDPGRAYMIYLTKDAEVIRFQKRTNANFHMLGVKVKKYDSSNTDYKSWNGIANPATYHAYLNVRATDGKGQVYNAETKRYELFKMNEHKLAVGQPIFVQVPDELFDLSGGNEATVAVSNNSYNPVRRRAKEQASLTRYELYLAPSMDIATDQVIVRMSEEKTENEYVVGQDLVKMGVSDLVPQMWIDRYDSKMCINTVAPEEDNTADYPLGIHVPQNGEYDLFLDDEPDNETMLYLTYDGEAIWNLSNGAYVANLEKGTNTHYGLRISAKSPQTATGIDEAVVDANGETRKVLINNQVYIIRGERVYSIDGQFVK